MDKVLTGGPLLELNNSFSRQHLVQGNNKVFSFNFVLIEKISVHDEVSVPLL